MQAIIDTKAQIRSVAQNLFRERGFTATSMRDLADSLDIKAASLYYHVKSKEDILQEICFRIADDFFKAIEQIDFNTKNADELLQEAISTHVKVIIDNLDAAAVFFHEWRHLSQPHLTKFITLRKKYERFFTKILKQGIAAKTFGNIDVKFTVLTIFSTINWVYEYYKPSGKMTPNEISRNLSNMILHGISTKKKIV